MKEDRGKLPKDESVKSGGKGGGGVSREDRGYVAGEVGDGGGVRP